MSRSLVTEWRWLVCDGDRAHKIELRKKHVVINFTLPHLVFFRDVFMLMCAVVRACFVSLSPLGLDFSSSVSILLSVCVSDSLGV